MKAMSREDLAEQSLVPLDEIERLEDTGEVRSIARLSRLARYFAVDEDALRRGVRQQSHEPAVFFRQHGAPDFFEDDRAILATQVHAGAALVAANLALGLAKDRKRRFVAKRPGSIEYQDGYEAARLVRKELAQPSGPLLDLQDVIEGEFETPITTQILQSSRVEAVTVKHPQGDGAVIVLNATKIVPDAGSPTFRRTLAHELAHVLLDLDEAPLGYILDHAPQKSSSRNPDKPSTEQRADAFAAELIIPTAGLLRLHGKPSLPIALDRARRLVEETEREFLAPRHLTIYHLFNKGYLDENTQELLSKELLPNLTSSVIRWRPLNHGYPQIVVDRLRDAHERYLLTAGRVRELLALGVRDPLPWESQE